MNIDIIKKCLEDYNQKLEHYDDINRYYYGNTDSLKNFIPKYGRSNLKPRVNFVQKLVDQEAQYSFANGITYTSLDNNKDVIKDIYNISANFKGNNDINLGIELIKNGMAFEINYLDKQGKLRVKTVSPLNGYALLDSNGDTELFLHIFTKQLDKQTKFIDVYTSNAILHFNENLEEIAPATIHYFGIVPVGVGIVGNVPYNEYRGYVEGDKTIYRTIKTLQDAFETNLGDITSEISDFRNAILKLRNITIEEDEEGNQKQPVIRNNSVLWLNGSKEEGEPDADWLIKQINDTFIKNTRDDIEKYIYSLTSHVDDNIAIASNVSGVALRSRLQSLESKCRENESAMKDIIKTRLICMFRYLELTQSKIYNVDNIKIQFTPCIPVDETALADIISKLPHDVVSYETMRSWLPRIDNVEAEEDKIKKEQKEMMEGQIDLDSIEVGEV